MYSIRGILTTELIAHLKMLYRGFCQLLLIRMGPSSAVEETLIYIGLHGQFPRQVERALVLITMRLITFLWLLNRASVVTLLVKVPEVF